MKQRKQKGLDRRAILRTGGSLLAAGALGGSLAGLAYGQSAAEATPHVNDDGLYEQPWFLKSFLELADDLETANDNNKRFAVFWELKGCPYCKETHFVNFARRDINDYIRDNFDVLQLNLIGSREVTDFDGETLSEKGIAEKYGIRFTPTIQFFPKTAEGLADKAPQKREIMRLPGYVKPDHFLALFEYIRNDVYEDGTSFRAYIKQKRA